MFTQLSGICTGTTWLAIFARQRRFYICYFALDSVRPAFLAACLGPLEARGNDSSAAIAPDARRTDEFSF